MATQIPNVELDITEEQVRSNVENFRQSNPVSRGTMSAPNIENSQRFNITDAPRQEAADKVIASTFIQPEIEAQPMQQKEDVSPEANELRRQIAERQDVLDELGLGGIKDSFEQLMQKGAFTSEAEDAAGIGDKTTALNEIQSQLRETDLRFRRDREALEDEVGLTKAQKNQSLATLSRTQARELADLSVIQATRRDDLATAQALVDRKVELTFEPIKQKLEFQEMMYQENKTLFNQAEQRQFEAKLRKEERAMEKDMFKFKQLETLKTTYLYNASEAGQSNGYLQSIQAAESEEDLFNIKGIQNYTLTGSEKLDKRLKQQQLQAALDTAARNAQIGEGGLSPELQKRIEGLSDGKREDLLNASETSGQIDSLIEIINSTEDITRLTPFTEEGRKFQRIAEDVADKMARERTGAVVSEDEQKSFKKILGLSFGSQILSDAAELESNLNNFKSKHDNTVRLIDPSGDITEFVNSGTNTLTETTYVDSVAKELSNPVSNWVSNYYEKN